MKRMSKKEKAKKIQRFLNEYFPKPQIPLKHKDTYTLLIAVLLSAQCTDVRVNSVTPHLFALADTPEKMSGLSYKQVQEIIRPCGLSERKAKAICTLSDILVEKYGGQVPDTFEALESLPGVGHKTASVVMVQGFCKYAFPVDTHIFRLARRWGLSSGKTVVTVEKDLKSLYPKKEWVLLHLQMIYYARAYCPARGHKLQLCPICQWLASL